MQRATTCVTDCPSGSSWRCQGALTEQQLLSTLSAGGDTHWWRESGPSRALRGSNSSFLQARRRKKQKKLSTTPQSHFVILREAISLALHLRCYLVSVSAVCIYLSFQLGSAAIQQLNSGGKVTQRLTRDTSTKRRGFPLLPHKRSEEAFLTLPSSYPQMIEAHPLHARDHLTLTSGIHICFATHEGFQNLDDTSCNKCVTVKNLYLRKQRHKRMWQTLLSTAPWGLTLHCGCILFSLSPSVVLSKTRLYYQ